MKINYGKGTTKHGPGVSIDLSGREIAAAIETWLVARDVHIRGPRTITVNGELCDTGHVYVDPSGYVIADGEEFLGSGEEC